MKLLITDWPPSVAAQVGADVYRRSFGLLATPRYTGSAPALALERGAAWACDNDCFQGLDRDAYLKMLRDLRGLPDCLFVTAPDVVGDAAATLARFDLWEPTLHYLGYPVAFVGQDGQEALPVPWDRCEAFFIGGSTTWKLGPHAAALAVEARRRGKWLHMGRVNTGRRLRYAQAIGCDSCDGSGWARFSNGQMPIAVRTLHGHTTPMWEGLLC